MKRERQMEKERVNISGTFHTIRKCELQLPVQKNKPIYPTKPTRPARATIKFRLNLSHRYPTTGAKINANVWAIPESIEALI